MLRILLMAFAIPSTAAAFTDADGSVAKLTDLERQLLSATFMFQLFDADSALVRNFRLDGQMNGCGLINARGLGGGFTGFRLFAVELPAGKMRTARTRGGPISHSEFDGPSDPVCEKLEPSMMGGKP